MYKIVRVYLKGGSRTIKSGLALAEAQAHCKDPETSSRTCTGSKAKARTRNSGPWFDVYQECTK
jgi:hypothetical protein